MGLFFGGGSKRSTKVTNEDNRQVFTDNSDRSSRFEFEDDSDNSKRAEDGAIIAGDGASVSQVGLGLDALTASLDFAEQVTESGFDTVDRQAGRSTDLAGAVSRDAFDFADDTLEDTLDFLGGAFNDSLEVSADSLGAAFSNTQAGLVKQQGDFMKYAGLAVIGVIVALGFARVKMA